MDSIVVIGGGAAGLMAACAASDDGTGVILIEKNEKLGKKLYITGKGRCNITNMRDPSECIEQVASNPYFLYSAFHSFTPKDVVQFFEGMGVLTKIERGGRVFPLSDKSSDVINALKKRLENNDVNIKLNCGVAAISTENGRVSGVRFCNGQDVKCSAVILATGGLSYPSTGSTGDGYKFATELGHTIIKPRPSLVPLITSPIVSRLQGVSLKNAAIRVTLGNKEIYKDFGEMLFTHKGVSGPVILSASRFIEDDAKNRDYALHIDLKPALTEKELDDRILRDFEKYSNRAFKNALDDLLPQKMIPLFVDLSEIDPDKKVHSVTRDERKKLVGLFKDFTVAVEGLAGYDEAIITAGGVCVDEINSSTMESKIIKGLFFAGEIIDVDGFTGGFNLQIAFSTGFLSGKNAANYIKR